MRTAGLLTVSQHALHRGGCLPRRGVCVCPGGGSVQGGCLPRGVSAQWGGVFAKGDVCLEGVSAQGRVSASGPGVYPSMQWGRHPPLWTDRHLWKHNLRKLRLRAVTSVSTRKEKRFMWSPLGDNACHAWNPLHEQKTRWFFSLQCILPNCDRSDRNEQ